MAIIKCPECGTEISSRAEKCICCGLPMSRVEAELYVDEVVKIEANNGAQIQF